MMMPGIPREFYRDVVYHRTHSGNLTLEEISNVNITVNHIENKLTIQEPPSGSIRDVEISAMSYTLSSITMTVASYASIIPGVRWVTVKGEFRVSSDDLLYDPKIYIRRCRKNIGEHHGDKSCDCKWVDVDVDEDPLIHLLKNSLCCKTRKLDDGKTNLLA